MKKLYVKDFYDETKYYLIDSKIEIVRRESSLIEAEEYVYPSGYGIFRKSGLFCKAISNFVAMYVNNNKIFLRVDMQEFDCEKEGIRVERISLFPYRKRFRIVQGEDKLFSLDYCYNDLAGTFPEDSEGDFFTFLLYQNKTILQKKRFKYYWTARAEGRNVNSQDFVNEIESYLQNF